MMKNKFKSRKFWMAVVGAGLLVANEGLGLDIDTETVIAFSALILAYIFGESFVDGKRASS